MAVIPDSDPGRNDGKENFETFYEFVMLNKKNPLSGGLITDFLVFLQEIIALSDQGIWVWPQKEKQQGYYYPHCADNADNAVIHSIHFNPLIFFILNSLNSL